MESKNNCPIKEALELVAEQEKYAEYSRVLSWGAIVVGVFVLGVFAYGQIKANEIQTRNKEYLSEIQDNDSMKQVANIVDTKIDLLRAEIKLRTSVSGIAGGVLLGVGIAGLFGRKKKNKQISVIKAIIHRIDNDS